MHSIIYAFHYMWCICGAGGETLGRLKKGFRRPLCAMRTITLCFDKANRTYGLLKCAKQCRLKKGFRRHLCGMRTITLCFGKANRTYGLLRFA